MAERTLGERGEGELIRECERGAEAYSPGKAENLKREVYVHSVSFTATPEHVRHSHCGIKI